ncbi:Chaperone surA precursor (Peptidyl-prolyl cis-trans isomerase surA) [Oleispira antarctica RB-8]|uniref:Chaperone SurA n=1 Tax=Oleispira antarctica RB-8 TaxID=698738 RepID=R4YKS1_OLEAN|nr:Chaperone surA precursor (Peptidyl-prolyl cis-trans isomerase surA) [Oleispira antarctica RB-8]
MNKKALLGLVAFCTAFSLSVNSNASPVDIDRIAAIVDESAIMQSELDARMDSVKRQMGGQMPPDSLLRPQVLERLILENIQLQMAERGGVQVSDQQLTDTVKRIAKQNGMTIEQFSAALKKDGLSYREAIEQIRTEMIISRVQKFQVNNRVQISQQDIDYFLASKAGQMATEAEYRLSHILISIPSQASSEEIKKARTKANDIIEDINAGKDFQQQAIAKSNGRNALKGGDLGWRKQAQLPSLFADAVIDLEPGEVSKPIKSASGFHIIQIADKRGGSTMLVLQTKVRHILVMPNEIRSDKDSKARIKQVYKKLDNGGDFAELAKEYSDDPGSAVSGGDLGWVNPGDMVPAFDRVMSEIEPGVLSQPFKSKFGWHILQVEERKETDLGEQVQRNQIHQMLQSRQFEEELPIWLRKIRSEAYVDIKES